MKFATSLLNCIALLCLVLICGGAGYSQGNGAPKGHSILGTRVAKGLVFEGKLWLSSRMVSRSDPTGALVSIDLSDSSEEVHFNRGVLDFAKSADRLWVLRASQLRARDFFVSEWVDGEFKDVARFRASVNDDPLALLNSLGGLIVLCQENVRILSKDDHGLSAIPLKGALRSGVQVSTAISGDGNAAYVGFNNGEWGGGLERVDLHSGMVRHVERRDSKELCAGPLNSECDPVTGVVPDTDDGKCVFAGVGLVHLGYSESRVLRVCGDSVKPVLEIPVENTGIAKSLRTTDAIYGLVPAGDGAIWAVTYRALIRLNRSGEKIAEYPLPKLLPVAGVFMSREVPGTIIVRTDLNWAVSTSGYTPLVVSNSGSQR